MQCISLRFDPASISLECHLFSSSYTRHEAYTAFTAIPLPATMPASPVSTAEVHWRTVRLYARFSFDAPHETQDPCVLFRCSKVTQTRQEKCPSKCRPTQRTQENRWCKLTKAKVNDANMSCVQLDGNVALLNSCCCCGC